MSAPDGGVAPRYRGVIALVPENCTSCMICVRECPDWCITVEAHTEVVESQDPSNRRRPKVENVLDRFAIDYSLCLYCGICVDVCPFDALHWSPEYDYAAPDRSGLVHDTARLGAWTRTVPPAPQLAEGAVAPQRPQRRTRG